MLKHYCSDILVEKCRAELFRPWIYKFGREIIVHSVKYVPAHSLHTIITTGMFFVYYYGYAKRDWRVVSL